MRQRKSYPTPFKVQIVQKAQCGKVWWLRGHFRLIFSECSAHILRKSWRG